jgi:cytochrome P450
MITQTNGTGGKDGAGASLLSTFDHVNPPIGRDGTPYEYYDAIRGEAIEKGRYVEWSDRHDGFWAVVGYEESVAVSRNSQAFSNHEATIPRWETNEPMMLAHQDDPEHRFARAMVNAPFGPGRVKHYAQSIRDNTNILIDTFIERGEADVSQLISMPIPAILTALILGLPAQDGPTFSRWARAVTVGFQTDPVQARVEIDEMYRYFEQTIAERRRNPGQDILSHVVHAEMDGRRFTHTEILGFCTAFMVGGIDNTNRLISTVLWRVGWDIALRHRLLRDPQLFGPAVDEFLRFYSPACIGRLVTEPVTIGQAHMEPGQRVLVVEPIANRDPRAFPYPDVFIPERSPNQHVGLGIGIHRCLGAHLITMEARVVLQEFLARLPEYSLNPRKRAQWSPGQVAGMSSVPIVFEPGQPIGDGKSNLGVDAWVQHAGGA